MLAYLFSRLESSYRHAVATVRWTVAGIRRIRSNIEKEPSRSLVLFVCIAYFAVRATILCR